MEITIEEIQKKFDTLPEELKWAIMSANVDDKIIDIGQKNGLNVAQMGQLSLETHMVMLGFTHPEDFEDSVKKSMRLGDDKTRAIINEVNDKVLKSIREKIMSLYTGGAPTTKEEVVKEDNILKNAGINIEPEQNTQPLNEKKVDEVEARDDMLSKVENPTLINSISGLKFTSSYKAPVVKSDHSVSNLSKQPNPNEPKPNLYPPKADPYRMNPE